MKWISRDNVTESDPYQIIRDTRDYSIWYRKDGKLGILCRGVPTLDVAKIFCANHASEHASTQGQ